MPLDTRLEALATAVSLPETLRTALETGGIAEARRLELFMGSGIAHERGGKLLAALRSAEGNEDLPDSPGNKVCYPCCRVRNAPSNKQTLQADLGMLLVEYEKEKDRESKSSATSSASASASAPKVSVDEAAAKAMIDSLSALTGVSIPTFMIGPAEHLNKAVLQFKAGVSPAMYGNPCAATRHTLSGLQEEREVNMGSGVTIKIDGEEATKDSIPHGGPEFLERYFRMIVMLAIAGTREVTEAQRRQCANLGENVWAITRDADGSVVYMYFTLTEALRHLYQFLTWSRSLGGSQLASIAADLHVRTQDCMTQGGLFFGTASMRALTTYNPSAMSRPRAGPSAAVVTPEKGKGAKGGKRPAASEAARPGPSRGGAGPPPCPGFQTANCRGGCGRGHVCEWCGDTSHGGQKCHTEAARRFRSGR